MVLKKDDGRKQLLYKIWISYDVKLYVSSIFFTYFSFKKIQRDEFQILTIILKIFTKYP
jgi:hypothetical protein